MNPVQKTGDASGLKKFFVSQSQKSWRRFLFDLLKMDNQSEETKDLDIKDSFNYCLKKTGRCK